MTPADLLRERAEAQAILADPTHPDHGLYQGIVRCAEVSQAWAVIVRAAMPELFEESGEVTR